MGAGLVRFTRGKGGPGGVGQEPGTIDTGLLPQGQLGDGAEHRHHCRDAARGTARFAMGAGMTGLLYDIPVE
jgi:hypothetical protein